MPKIFLNQEEIFDAKPALIGEGPDGTFYHENPLEGDEAPLIINVWGNWYETDEWELPQ